MRLFLCPSICLLLVSVLFMPLAWAQSLVTTEYVPQAQLVGKARMKVLLWKVYDATLYAPQGRWQADQPFALSLEYLRPLSGEAIAQRSIDEIRQQGFRDEITLARWQQRLEQVFPDVTRGSNLTGIRDVQGHTLFYHDGDYLQRIDDPRFATWFFNIWLGEHTSAPTLRHALLGTD